ncbi:DUF1992 domain-containing protein [Bacillaceae bacterium Marseille-Q3522]|nr:DUF1992 domain-containing protein [Bacillaceae bacterium Marseille-Q3522]
MDFSRNISEERIKKAYEDGEFNHLPGFGKPFPKDDDLAAIPEELRMAYRILKNSGFSVEENQLKQEMMTIEDLLKACDDEREKEQLQNKLNEKLLRFNQAMAKRGKQTNSSIFKNYQDKIYDRFYEK